jgi:hypothetical protein
MARLIAFDQQTASNLVARTRTAAQLGHGSPLKAAIATEDEATLLMPGAQRDQVLVVSVKRPAQPMHRFVAEAPQKQAERPVAPTPAPPEKKPVRAVQDDEPVAYEATGFLGLEDSPLYAEDLQEQAKEAKKKWWQKLLD